MKILFARWQALTEKFNAEPGSAERLYNDIEMAYGHRNRHYHNLSHLEFMFEEIDRENINDVHLEYATWYHDIVYKPGNLSSEMKSSIIANEALNQLGVTQDIITKVCQMIIATKDHSCDPIDEVTASFIDVDMSILGSASPVYKQYAESIRKEAAWLPDILYRKARLDFLTSLDLRESLFITETFKCKYEHQARQNIEEEKQLLNGPS